MSVTGYSSLIFFLISTNALGFVLYRVLLSFSKHRAA